MQKTVFVIIACALAQVAQGQIQPKDSLYIVTYTTGSAWDQSKSPAEQPYFKEHSSRLSKLRKDGVIRFGARYAEKGIIVISASHLKAAQELVSADVSVANNTFNADVQKLNIFYDGCLEKIK